MYLPAHFDECDDDEIRRIVSAHPLATIVYSTPSGVDAQHIPLIFDGERRLIGHFAADSDALNKLHDGDSVLAIFNGQCSYVSPGITRSSIFTARSVS